MLHNVVEVGPFSLSVGAGACLLDLPSVDKAVLCLVEISCDLVIYCANWEEIIAAVEASCLGAAQHWCEHQQGAFPGAEAVQLVALLGRGGKDWLLNAC